jgi:hypothetical protein
MIWAWASDRMGGPDSKLTLRARAVVPEVLSRKNIIEKAEAKLTPRVASVQCAVDQTIPRHSRLIWL